MSASAATPCCKPFKPMLQDQGRNSLLPHRVTFARDSICSRRRREIQRFPSRSHLVSRSNGERQRKLAGEISRGALQQLSSALGDDRKEAPLPEYTPGPLDELFLKQFREKLTEEADWDSQKPGYDGLLEVVKHLYLKSSKPETEKATIRVFTALLPHWLVISFRRVILPIASGKAAAVLMAFATKATCQWLMGPCTVNQVTLADGSVIPSGVLVHRCKFLEESKCAGICTHACKIPTQAFMRDVMGATLAMEPNFQDFSCQFKYGVEALPRDQDPGLQTPCLSICPTAIARSALRPEVQMDQCPQVQ